MVGEFSQLDLTGHTDSTHTTPICSSTHTIIYTHVWKYKMKK